MAWFVFLRSAVGAVFAAAAFAKLASRSSLRPFLEALAVPHAPARLIAALVPPVEALCGFTLLAGVGRWPALAACCLGIGFAVILIIARQTGVSVGCGCFGPMDSGDLSPVSIIRAILLALACCALLAADLSGVPGSGSRPAGYPTVMTVVLGVVAGLIFVASAALFGEIWMFRQVTAEMAAAREQADSAARNRPAVTKT
jgi:Methylamine utilisation protein MauE